LGQVTVQEYPAVGYRAATMVGDDKNGRVGGELLDYPASRGIKPFIHLPNRILKARVDLRVMKEMVAVHVLPEVVLDRVYRHEDKHHHVLRMLFQKVKGGCDPLPVELFHFGKHLIPSLVRGHEPEVADIME